MKVDTVTGGISAITVDLGNTKGATVQDVLDRTAFQMNWTTHAVLGVGLREYVPQTSVDDGETLFIVINGISTLLRKMASATLPVDTEAIRNAADAFANDTPCTEPEPLVGHEKV